MNLKTLDKSTWRGYFTASLNYEQRQKNGSFQMAQNKKKGKIIVDRERCKGCYLCIEVCPFHIIEVDQELNRKGYHPARPKEDISEDGKGCTACTMCALVCPEVAIEVYRAK